MGNSESVRETKPPAWAIRIATFFFVLLLSGITFGVGREISMNDKQHDGFSLTLNGHEQRIIRMEERDKAITEALLDIKALLQKAHPNP